MKTLQTKSYSRAEIAEILELDSKDTNFARKVKDTLQKWGYSYQYKRTQVTILKIPQTREKRIAEIAQRELGLDVRTNSLAFSAFLFALQFSEDFNCSPWATKAKLMKDMFGIEVAESTLRKWTKKLLDQNIIIKDAKRELWCTAIINNKKRQFRVTDFELYNVYKQKSQELFQSGESWSLIYKTLWTKYKAVYYWCKPFICNAFENESIKEMLGLIEDLYIYENGIIDYNSEIEEIHLFE